MGPRTMSQPHMIYCLKLLFQLLHVVNLLHQHLLGEEVGQMGEGFLHQRQAASDGHLTLYHAVETSLGDDGG